MGFMTGCSAVYANNDVWVKYKVTHRIINTQFRHFFIFEPSLCFGLDIIKHQIKFIGDHYPCQEHLHFVLDHFFLPFFITADFKLAITQSLHTGFPWR